LREKKYPIFNLERRTIPLPLKRCQTI